MIGTNLYLLSNIFYHRSTTTVFKTVLLDILWRLWKLLFFEVNIFKVFLYLFFYIKTSNFHNPGKIGRTELCYSSMNNIFNALSIGLENTLSFKWTNFGLKCLVPITSNGLSLKFKATVWNISKSLFRIVDSSWVVIYRTENKDGVQLGMYFLGQSGFQQVSGILRME